MQQNVAILVTDILVAPFLSPMLGMIGNLPLNQITYAQFSNQ